MFGLELPDSLNKPQLVFGRCVGTTLARQGGAVVADDGMPEKQVFFLGTPADVVENQRYAAAGGAIGNDADMQQPAAGKLPGDDVAGNVGGRR